MGTLNKMQKFNEFVLEKRGSTRETAISTAVNKVKERFGDTNDKFLESVEEKGVEEIKDYIIKILLPFIDQIEAEEKMPNGLLKFDFDGLLEGLVSWSLVDLELQIIKKQEPE